MNAEQTRLEACQSKMNCANITSRFSQGGNSTQLQGMSKLFTSNIVEALLIASLIFPYPLLLHWFISGKL